MAHIVVHEIAWLLLGVAAVGLLGALRQTVIMSFVAVGILAGKLFASSAETASQIRFLAQSGVALLLLLAGLKLDGRLVRTLGLAAHATIGHGQFAPTPGLR